MFEQKGIGIRSSTFFRHIGYIVGYGGAWMKKVGHGWIHLYISRSLQVNRICM